LYQIVWGMHNGRGGPHKIQGIKAIREWYGLGLRDAKLIFDDWYRINTWA